MQKKLIIAMFLVFIFLLVIVYAINLPTENQADWFSTMNDDKTGYLPRQHTSDGQHRNLTIYGSNGILAVINGSELIMYGNITATGRINASNISAARFTGKLDCAMIDGGSDADFCADADSASSIPSSNFQYANITEFLGVDNASILKVGNISNILNLYQIKSNISDYLGGSDINASLIKIGNLTSRAISPFFATVDTTTLKVDFAIVNKQLLIFGNISSVNVTNVNINGSLYPAIDDIFDIGNKTLRWKSANFSGVGEFGSLTSPTIRLTNLQQLDTSNFFTCPTCSASVTASSISSAGVVSTTSISITESQISNLGATIQLQSNAWQRANTSDYLGGPDVNASLIKAGNTSWVVTNEINPSNATIELGNIGGYGAIWRIVNLTDFFGTAQINKTLVRINTTNWSGNYGNLTIAGTVNATKLNGTLSCSMINDGSDADFCTDANSGGGGITNNSDANITLLNVYKLNGTELSLFNKSIDLTPYTLTSSLSIYQIAADAFKHSNLTNRNVTIMNLSIGENLVLGWTNLTKYPSACTSSQTITAIGDTITCSAISITESAISDLRDYVVVGTNFRRLNLTDFFGTTQINKTIARLNYSNYGNLTIAGIINATKLNGSLSCSMITDGTDADFCADDTSAGGASSNFQYANITEFLGVGNESVLKQSNISNINKDNWNFANNDSVVLDNGSIIRTANLSLIFKERNESLWNRTFGNKTYYYTKEANATVIIGSINLTDRNATELLTVKGNVSIDADLVIGSAASARVFNLSSATGLLKIANDFYANAIYFTGSLVQVEAPAFKIINLTNFLGGNGANASILRQSNISIITKDFNLQNISNYTSQFSRKLENNTNVKFKNLTTNNATLFKACFDTACNSTMYSNGTHLIIKVT